MFTLFYYVYIFVIFICFITFTFLVVFFFYYIYIIEYIYISTIILFLLPLSCKCDKLRQNLPAFIIHVHASYMTLIRCVLIPELHAITELNCTVLWKIRYW